jgi:hypothetical protein
MASALTDIAMHVSLTRIGFNQPALQIIKSILVTDAKDFHLFSYPKIGQFIHCCRCQTAIDFVINGPLGLKALQTCLHYCFIRCKDLDDNLFDKEVCDKWILFIDILDKNIKNPLGKNVTTPPMLTNFIN